MPDYGATLAQIQAATGDATRLPIGLTWKDLPKLMGALRVAATASGTGHADMIKDLNDLATLSREADIDDNAHSPRHRMATLNSTLSDRVLRRRGRILASVCNQTRREILNTYVPLIALKFSWTFVREA